MKMKTYLFVLSVFFFFDHVMSVQDYKEKDVEDCCEKKINNKNDQEGCKDRLKERCEKLTGAYYDRCASNVVDTFVDNERFGAGQGNDLLHCLVGHNVNQYKWDRNNNLDAYGGVLEAVGVTSVSGLDFSKIVDKDIEKDTIKEIEKCEEDCKDRSDFVECCKDWVVKIREKIKYSEEFMILGECRKSSICKSNRYLRG